MRTPGLRSLGGLAAVVAGTVTGLGAHAAPAMQKPLPGLLAFGDATRALGPEVPLHENGRRSRVFVLQPERGAVDQADALEVVRGPGLTPTFVAINRVVVGLHGNVGEREAAAIGARLGLGAPVQRIEGPKSFSAYVFQTPGALRAFTAADQAMGLPGVKFAHPDGYGTIVTTETPFPQRVRNLERARAANVGAPDGAAEPEIRVNNPNGQEIPDNTGSYAFPEQDEGDPPVPRTFSILNSGGADLELILPITVSPPWTVIQQPTSPVPPNTTTSFILQLPTTLAGNYTGRVTIVNNDPNEAVYDFAISGVISPPGPGAFIDDPLFEDQWHHYNEGQGSPAGSPGFDINIIPAWGEDLRLGDGATVAILDDGTQPDHPDYQANVLAELLNVFNYAASENRGPGSHGTAVAGCVAAIANSTGVRGSAPAARLTLTSFDNTFADLAQTMYDADAQGADVHTNSWKFIDPTFLPAVMADAIADLSATGRNGAGMLFLFAAANDSNPIAWGSSLASLPQVVTVGAMTNFGRRSAYSNFGPKLDFVAPSSGGSARIVTTDVTGANGYTQGTGPEADYTTGFGGTSAATPIAAGVAALIYSINPELTSEQVRRILRHSAINSSQSQLLVAGSDRPINGVSRFGDSFGFGLINADLAVQAAQRSLTNNDRTWPAIPSNLRATRSATGTTVQWTNPPTGTAGEYSQAMLVRYTGFPFTRVWQPEDGRTYGLGIVEGTTTVLAVGDISTFTDPGVRLTASPMTYAVFAINQDGRYSAPAVFRSAPVEAIQVFADNADGASPAWTFTGEWERGAPDTQNINIWDGTTDIQIPLPPSLVGFTTPNSGPNVFATDLNGNYADDTVHALTSPVIDLRNPQWTSASVSYVELLDVEGNGFDSARLEIIDAVSDVVLRTVAFNMQDLTYTWRPQWFDLRSQMGRQIRLRWILQADETGSFAGWYLDDIRVAASSLGQGPIIPGQPRRIILPPPFGFGIPLGDGFMMSMVPPPAADQPTLDINGDGQLGAGDLAELLAVLGEEAGSPRFRQIADLTGDGRIGMTDVTSLIAAISTAAAQ